MKPWTILACSLLLCGSLPAADSLVRGRAVRVTVRQIDSRTEAPLAAQYIRPNKTAAICTIAVGETVSFSLGAGSNCTAAASRNAAIATSARNNGIFQGGFDVTGVAPGVTVVDYSFTDSNGVAQTGKCYVTVK